jgi:hypothetical protein
MRVAEARNLKELIPALEALRQERLAARLPFEELWWNNLAMIAGDHYMRWEPTQGTYVERPPEEHEVRIVLNHCRVVARTELAKLTKSKPIMDVIAKSEDQDDLAATKVASFVLDSCEQKYDLRRYRKSAYVWMIAAGMGAVYVGYDPENETDGRTKYLIDPATGEPTFHPDRQRELEQMMADGVLDELTHEEYALGDLDFKVYSPFQLLPDDTALDWNDIQDLITTDVIHIDKAKSIWGKDLRAEAKQPGVIEHRVIHRLGRGVGEQFGAGDMKNTVQIHTWWLPPGVFTHNSYLKDGIMVRWANTYVDLEENKPYPFIDKQIPFAYFTHIDNPTAIWADSVITDIRAANLELDRTVSQLLENRDYMTNPMWRVPEQVQLRGGRIKSQPGGEVKYVHIRDVPPPEPIPGTPLPVQVENLAVALRDQILDLSGQGEVSRGRVPSGVRSGIQIAYLQEEDETKLAPTADNIEVGCARMASLVLSRLSQFWTHERILRYYKRGGEFEVRKFKGADLRGHTDVVPVAGSALPKSKAARQQNAMALAELGIDADAKRLKDILELGQGEPDEIDLARAQADRENEMMIQGAKTIKMRMSEEAYAAPVDPENTSPEEGPIAIPVKAWHNHEAHLERHRRYMMDEEFERLGVEHPDIVRLFDEHVTMHEQALQAQMQAQMEQMMAIRGMPDGPPGSPAAPKRETPTATT